MYAVESLFSRFTVDAGAMNNPAATVQSPREFGYVVQAQCNELYATKFADARLSAVDSASD
jgi:hypothetical protein